MILASNNFLTSLSMRGSKRGLILLSFCLKGLASSLTGMVCYMTEVSYTLRSSYFQAKTLVYFFKRAKYSSLAFSGRLLEIFMNLGSLAVPIFRSSTLVSEGTTLGVWPHHYDRTTLLMGPNPSERSYFSIG